MKDDIKSIPWNQESSNLDMISWRIEDWSGEKISDEEIAILTNIKP